MPAEFIEPCCSLLWQITLTFWESEDAMRASEEAANQLRQQAADEMEEEIAGVERFEVYVFEPPAES